MKKCVSSQLLANWTGTFDLKADDFASDEIQELKEISQTESSLSTSDFICQRHTRFLPVESYQIGNPSDTEEVHLQNGS